MNRELVKSYPKLLHNRKYKICRLIKHLIAVVILILHIVVNSKETMAKSSLLSMMGISSNSNRPEIWKDQLGSYATGGSLYVRAPTSEIQLMSMDMPSFDMGCGAMSTSFGGFGFISGKQIETMVKQIASSALSYAVMLTIKSISPQISDLLENLEAMARFMNAQTINSCRLGASIAAGLMPKTEESHRLKCKLKKTAGSTNNIADKLSDGFLAGEECEDTKTMNDANSEDKDTPLLPTEYNLVWHALKKEADNLPRSDKEFLMSLSGTLLSLKEGENGSISFKHKPSLMKGHDMLNAIIFGGNITSFKLYKCDNDEEDKCLKPTAVNQKWEDSESMLNRVTDIMKSMEKKILEEKKGDNLSLDAKEMDLLSKSSIPIFNALSQHAATKGHGVKYAVEDYAESVAFDYTLGYLDELTDFVYRAISNLEHAQMESDVIKNFKEELRSLRLDLFHERSKAMNRLHIIQSVKQTTKQMENQAFAMFADYRDKEEK